MPNLKFTGMLISLVECVFSISRSCRSVILELPAKTHGAEEEKKEKKAQDYGGPGRHKGPLWPSQAFDSMDKNSTASASVAPGEKSQNKQKTMEVYA